MLWFGDETNGGFGEHIWRQVVGSCNKGLMYMCVQHTMYTWYVVAHGCCGSSSSFAVSVAVHAVCMSLCAYSVRLPLLLTQPLTASMSASVAWWQQHPTTIW